MAERVGFRSGPQAPSPFVKLRLQCALFGPNHLDHSIILHAETPADRTSPVHDNDSLFIYKSYATFDLFVQMDRRSVCEDR